MSSIPTIAAEKASLETHVDLCAERYKELDSRLESVEQKIDAVVERVDSIGSEFKKSLVNAVATIMVALLGAVATIVGVVITHAK
jgi:predicted PP-loop superfamily ATPase